MTASVVWAARPRRTSFSRARWVRTLRLAQDHDVIQAFSRDRTDEPFEGPFFHGERGAVDQSRMPIAWILRVTTAP